MAINKGWYPDLQRKNRRRYWDGQQWGPPKLTAGAVLRRVLAIAGGSFGGLIVLFIVLALVIPTGSSGSSVVAPVAPGSARGRADGTSRPAASQTATTSRSSPDDQTPKAGTTTSAGPSTKPGGTKPSSSASESGRVTKPSPATTSSPLNRPSRHGKPHPTKTATTSAPKAGTALAAVSALTVKGRAPKTGYSRTLFGASWSDIDHNGCRQRDDVLNRDLTDKRFDGCTVLSGILHDPYTGATIRFHRGLTTSTKVQIDHVVALSDAWQKGAQQWSADKRRSFANDTLNLLAVGQSVNESKGDGDTATWLPPNKSYRCAYVARQVAVKTSYGLWVTTAERAAMSRILSTCPNLRLPTRSAIPSHPGTKPRVKTSPTRQQPPRKTDTSSGRKTTNGSGASNGTGTTGSRVVHPGAFCTPRNSTGVTVKGTPMVCSTKPGDPRARWRSAG